MKRTLITICTLVAVARADSAADLVKQGLDEYRAGKYGKARVSLEKAYELDRKPDTLFALAQAERLDGDCKTAIGHYRTVIQQVPDINVAKLVQQSLSLCGEPEPEKPTASPEAPPAKTITRTETRVDKLAAASFGFGAAALGLGGGLVIASNGNRDAADVARTLGDHDDLQHRANLEMTAGVVSAGVGVALVGFAVYRWAAGHSSTTDVAALPTAHGGSLFVTLRY